jgi:broad specificity phosphatase PhoE
VSKPTAVRKAFCAAAAILLAGCEQPTASLARLQPSPAEDVEILAARLGLASSPDLQRALRTLEILLADHGGRARPSPGGRMDGPGEQIEALERMRLRETSRELMEELSKHARKMDAEMRARPNRVPPGGGARP